MTTPILSCVEEVRALPDAKSSTTTFTIKCYVFSLVADSTLTALRPDRRLAAQAITLLMQIDGALRLARADWNEDRFRRLMRLRSTAVRRVHGGGQCLPPTLECPWAFRAGATLPLSLGICISLTNNFQTLRHSPSC